MKQNIVFFTILLGIIFLCQSCGNDSIPETDIPLAEQLENCEALKDLEIIEEEDLACNYNTVFLFQNDIYIVCTCCACSKFVITHDCNMEPLCEFDDGCMEEFFQTAEFLFFTELVF